MAFGAGSPKSETAAKPSRRLKADALTVVDTRVKRGRVADLRLLQNAMEHASITVTAHTYADRFDDELDDIAVALDSLSDDLSRST